MGQVKNSPDLSYLRRVGSHLRGATRIATNPMSKQILVVTFDLLPEIAPRHQKVPGAIGREWNDAFEVETITSANPAVSPFSPINVDSLGNIRCRLRH